MRVTLFGLLTFAVIAGLLVYAGDELYRTSQANAPRRPQNPDPSTNP
jgi:hypothetical protein